MSNFEKLSENNKNSLLAKTAALIAVGSLALVGCGSNADSSRESSVSTPSASEEPLNEQPPANSETNVGEFDDKYLNPNVEPKYTAAELIEQINFHHEEIYGIVNKDVYIEALQLAEQGQIEQAAKILENNGIGQANMAIASVASETICKNPEHHIAIYGKPIACYSNIADYFRSKNIPEELPIWGDRSLQQKGFYTLEYLTSKYPTQAEAYEQGGNEAAIEEEIAYQEGEINEEVAKNYGSSLSESEIDARKGTINDLNKLPEVIDYYETKQANEK